MTNILIIFTALTVLNVILSTVKSILTINGNKWVASFSSALYYGYYNIVLIYTVADFPLYQKVIVTTICNLIGVFLVKTTEEKLQKERLWKIETTIYNTDLKDILEECKMFDLSFNYSQISPKYTVMNFYCPTKKDTECVKKMLSNFKVKYFVNESKKDW